MAREVLPARPDEKASIARRKRVNESVSEMKAIADSPVGGLPQANDDIRALARAVEELAAELLDLLGEE